MPKGVGYALGYEFVVPDFSNITIILSMSDIGVAQGKDRLIQDALALLFRRSPGLKKYTDKLTDLLSELSDSIEVDDLSGETYDLTFTWFSNHSFFSAAEILGVTHFEDLFELFKKNNLKGTLEKARALQTLFCEYGDELCDEDGEWRQRVEKLLEAPLAEGSKSGRPLFSNQLKKQFYVEGKTLNFSDLQQKYVAAINDFCTEDLLDEELMRDSSDETMEEIVGNFVNALSGHKVTKDELEVIIGIRDGEPKYLANIESILKTSVKIIADVHGGYFQSIRNEISSNKKLRDFVERHCSWEQLEHDGDNLQFLAIKSGVGSTVQLILDRFINFIDSCNRLESVAIRAFGMHLRRVFLLKPILVETSPIYAGIDSGNKIGEFVFSDRFDEVYYRDSEKPCYKFSPKQTQVMHELMNLIKSGDSSPTEERVCERLNTAVPKQGVIRTWFKSDGNHKCVQDGFLSRVEGSSPRQIRLNGDVIPTS